jgi:signal transduction histidine kinase
MTRSAEQLPLSNAPSSAVVEDPDDHLQQALLARTREERQALADTLHQSLCQSLTGIQLLMRLAEKKALAQNPDLAADLGELRQMIGSASEEMHLLVRALRNDGAST